MTITIPDNVFDAYNEGVQAMMTAFAVNCTLEYPPTKTECPNCYINPITGRSSNIYKSGGPESFTDSICPYCDGAGYAETIITEDIKLRCYYSKKEWQKIGLDLRVKAGGVVTYGYIADMAKCLRANKIIMNTDISGYGLQYYVLDGNPIPHGFKHNKYFIAIWTKAE